MTRKFKNKYRVDTTRLKDFDYGSASHYFITVCVKNRIKSFGEIKNGEMILSELGKIAHQEWLNTFDLRPDMNLTMGEFIIMPDHFHAIISIGENEYNKEKRLSKFENQSKNIGSIMRGFKSSVTTYARKNDYPNFQWQPRFHDHIIRDSKAHQRIAKYIEDNPKNWKKNKINDALVQS